LRAFAVIMPLRTLARHFNRLSPLLVAPAAMLLSQGQAKAILTYNIFESGGDVVVQTSGSLDLPLTSNISSECYNDGGIHSAYALYAQAHKRICLLTALLVRRLSMVSYLTLAGPL
jgi:hypothetical protein